MLKEFREFAMRGNVVDLAIGVIIGAAFGKIVASLVNDVLMPPLGLLLGQVDFSNIFINLSGTHYDTLAAAKAAGAATINIGLFVNAVVDFLIVAFAIFRGVRDHPERRIGLFAVQPQAVPVSSLPRSISDREEGRMLRTMLRGLAALLLAATMASPALAAKGQTKLHWYGQAAWKITTPSGGVILIDPWLTVPTNPDKNSIAELGRVDYILITHGHRDHVGDAVEIAKKTGAKLLAPYALAMNMVSVLGYPKDQALPGGNVGGTIDLPNAGAKVLIVNAIHGSELTAPQLPNPGPGQPAALTSGNPVGYVLMIKDGPTIYHTGDTDVSEDMKLIPTFHHIDVMLACIGGYFTMDPVRAALAVQLVKPEHVIPMHFGTYGLLAGTPAEFRAALAKRKLDNKLIVLKPGGDISF